MNPFGQIGQKTSDCQETVRIHRESLQKIAEAQQKAEQGMMRKFDCIAELFELGVLSEDDALKACKTVIQQHAKKRPMIGNDT